MAAKRPTLTSRGSAFQKPGAVSPKLPTEPAMPAARKAEVLEPVRPELDDDVQANLRSFTILLTETNHKALRRYSFENEISLQQLGLEATQYLFDKYGLGQVTEVKAYRKKG